MGPMNESVLDPALSVKAPPLPMYPIASVLHLSYLAPITQIPRSRLGSGPRVANAADRTRPRPERSIAMLWRRLLSARAWWAAGLLAITCSVIALGDDTPTAPKPAPRAVRPTATGVKVSTPAPKVSASRASTTVTSAARPETETVRVLDGQRAGVLKVEARGQGRDHVAITVQNTSSKRLNVIFPPGLVAANVVGQRAGGGGGGGQSMGLGSIDNQGNAFGQFQRPAAAGNGAGLHSVGNDPVSASRGVVTVPPGKSIQVVSSSACLNFGLATPTSRDRLTLMDVNDYSNDSRVRKALRSLSTYGTSQGVAQAALWNICNGLSFATMSEHLGQPFNMSELALATRFVEAVDTTASDDLVDVSTLTEGRLFVRVVGEGKLAGQANRLGRALDGKTVLGLKVRSIAANDTVAALAPALLLNVVISAGPSGETKGRVAVNYTALSNDQWTTIGRASFREGSEPSILDADDFARSLDHAVSSALVTVKPYRRGTGVTTLRVENKLPFTIDSVLIKASNASGSSARSFIGLGVGPGRSSLAPIEAASGSIDRVVLNGL